MAASLIRDHGLQKGQRVILFAPSGVRTVITLFGLFRAGIVAVPLDLNATPGFFEAVRKKTEAIAVIAPRAMTISGELQNIAIENLTLVPAAAVHPPEPRPEDVAQIVFTSGTTGDPKGVVLTHLNILSDLRGVSGIVPRGEDMHLVSILPLSHMFEQTVGLFLPMLQVGVIHYTPSLRPSAIIAEIPARNMRATQRAARWIALRGLTPNMISGIGLAVGVGAGAAHALTQVFPGSARVLWAASAVMIVLRGLSNMRDGMVAVEQGRGTPTGVFWNEVPDRISDVALLVGAGYGLGGSAFAGWFAACLAIFVAYVRAVGVLAGAPANYHGPFAKQQRMFSVAALAAILSLAPEDWRFQWGSGGAWGPMAVLLWVMVPGIAWTALLRIRRATRFVALMDRQ